MSEPIDIKAEKRKDHNMLLVSQLNHILNKIEQGGGPKKLEKHHSKGKWSARERISYLLDDENDFLEIGALAAYEMYEEYGGCPAAGVITGIGRISGKLCVIVANDATVKAGAFFPMTGKKNLRAQEIALENHLPVIYLVDSAGVFLPLQDEIFPDKEHFGRVFRNNAVLSAKGIPQISAIMGSCVAGGAYLPIMSDEALIVKNTGSIFLAGPHLVKAAIGEEVDAQTLGGADTTSRISGIADYSCDDDPSCLDKIKELVGHMSIQPKTKFPREQPKKPNGPEQVYARLPESRQQPYNTLQLLETLVDEDSILQFKEEYGKTILCAYARIDGWSVGIVANNREVVKGSKGEMQIGGVIYSDSSDKAARFIMNCNQKKIPLVFVQDVTGFMVGKRSEHGGIIKDGAKLVNAVSNSVVPKFTIIVGNSYGAGNYAMCGKAYDPRLIVAWPSARLAVMGGDQAAKVLTDIQLRGKEVTEEEKEQLFQQVRDRYESQASPYYAAARLWIDAIIDPKMTRQVISAGIEMASHAPLEEFKTGVLQT